MVREKVVYVNGRARTRWKDDAPVAYGVPRSDDAPMVYGVPRSDVRTEERCFLDEKTMFNGQT